MATNSSVLPQLSPLNAFNQTVGQWRVDPLSPNVTAVNGTLMNGTLVNGKPYNGTLINGTTVIELVPLSNIGTLPVITFIYMLLSLLILLSIAYSFKVWIWVALNRAKYKYVRNSEKRRPSGLTLTAFDSRLRIYYNPAGEALPEAPKPSYAETVTQNPSGDFGPEALWNFRQLIQAKYKLDLQIWNFRDAVQANIPLLDDMKRRSQGATDEMRRIVERWEAGREKWSAEDWAKVQEIKARLG